jgi:uncharacterized protein (DUF2236 family)
LLVIDSAPSADAAAGLFGPGSMTWKVDREVAVLVGSGSRALMMQVAHPLVAAAVAEHSRYLADPLGRLRGTLDAIYTFAFADTDHALEVVRGIHRLHTTVQGNAPDGRAYSALEPRLLLWVYATLIDSSLVAYETFVASLRTAERDTYYAEFCRAGHVWGIPAESFPPDLAALRGWMAHMIASGEVHVSEQGRRVGQDLMQPPLWWLPAPVTLPLRLLTTWLLPPALRGGFGHTWGPRREAAMQHLAAGSRAIVPRLPSRLRDLPIARAADRRLPRR